MLGDLQVLERVDIDRALGVHRIRNEAPSEDVLRQPRRARDIDRCTVAGEDSRLVLPPMRLLLRQKRLEIAFRVAAHHRERMKDMWHLDAAHEAVRLWIGPEQRGGFVDMRGGAPVSYTHLTLPTIYSV